MFQNRFCRAICWVTLSLTVWGCHRQRAFEPTYAVRGAVTLDGKPLADGTIVFCTPATGDLQAMPIKAGVYSGQARAGNRRVEIRAYLPRPESESGPNSPPPVNYLPGQYNVDTVLSADVTPAGANTFDFNLKGGRR